MPRNSAFYEAIAQDEQLGEAIARDDSTAAPSRRMSEYSVEVELLSVVCDRLAEVIQAIIALGRGQPRSVTPMPRPVTAAARARHKLRMQRHQALVARVLAPEDRAGVAP